MAVAVEQLAIVQRRHLEHALGGQRLAADGDDAVGDDAGARAGTAVHPAEKGETVIAGVPGDEVFGVVKAGVLPTHPTMRHTMHVEGQDQRLGSARGAHGRCKIACLFRIEINKVDSNSNSGSLRLWQGLAASLALHALLLSQTVQLPDFEASAPPLAANLLPAEQPRIPAVPAAAKSAEQAVLPSQISTPKPELAPPVSTATVAPAAPAAVATPAAAGVAASLPGGVTPAPAEGPGLDADSLRSYRFGLAAAARRFKRYPLLAIERGLSGRAEVRLDISANGSSPPPRLIASSGSTLLDEAALDMVARAAAATVVPRRLSGAVFSVDLPVEFDLQEER